MLRLLTSAADAAGNLAKVQANFSGPREINVSHVMLIAGVVLGILIIGGAVALIRRLKRRRSGGSGWSSITNPNHIWDILSRAVSRQASAILELYQTDHTLTYKGTIASLEGDLLAVSLLETPSADMDFKDLPGVVHLNFRPGPKESMEHYRFTSRVQDSRYGRLKTGIRETQLLVPLPKVLTSAQRRSYLRLEPSAPFSLECRLHEVPKDSLPGLASLEFLANGPVLDISIGGCQIRVDGPSAIRENQRFVGVMELPDGDPSSEITGATLVTLMQLLSQDRVDGAEGSGQGQGNVLRLRFLGRYLQDPIQKNWIYRGITSDSLDDLARWLQAYQRYVIKKKRNLMSADSPGFRPRNMFPSTPPKRPPLRD
ncbi:MAG: PilZ domain-containing protein [Deltaproteobacteria bacterium]|jgi:hypothetical protein|nr:PilZ domain-containing protein [Deltaproteobacteria bacterium]